VQVLTKTLSLRLLSQMEAETPALLPPELRDWQFPRIDPEWCWVVEHESAPIALVLASPAHGMLMVWRVLSTASARRTMLTWFLAAFPKILDNARLRGCVGYGSFFHDDRPEEAKLARLLQRNRGVLEPFSGTFGVAVIPGAESNAGPGDR
jgi:hypothetical protein